MYCYTTQLAVLVYVYRCMVVAKPAKTNAKQKHLGCKKCEANQKQQLSDYGYIAILATKNFDIRLRPRIS